jgi:hypothetical protein
MRSAGAEATGGWRRKSSEAAGGRRTRRGQIHLAETALCRRGRRCASRRRQIDAADVGFATEVQDAEAPAAEPTRCRAAACSGKIDAARIHRCPPLRDHGETDLASAVVGGVR